MKAFEEWATRNDMYDRIEARKIWRAALKWTIQKSMSYHGNDFLFTELYKDIKEELKGA